jgi:hypothetical protein
MYVKERAVGVHPEAGPVVLRGTTYQKYVILGVDGIVTVCEVPVTAFATKVVGEGVVPR